MRNVMLALGLAAGTIGLTATSAPAQAQAQAQSFSESRVINSFDEETLRVVLSENGATVERKSDGGYLISYANGNGATAKFTVCDTGRCRGTNLTARFGKPSDKSDARVADLVRDFNRRWNAAKAYLTDDGRAVVQTYIVVDGGITMENYRAQLNIYGNMLQKMRETIYTD